MLTFKVIILPILMQVVLVILIYILLGIRRYKAANTQKINYKATAIDNKAWSNDVVKVSNNLANQYELPVVFFMLCWVLHTLNAVDVTVIIVAWCFVLSRYIHAFIHITSNHVPTRFKLFIVGLLAVIFLTIKSIMVILGF